MKSSKTTLSRDIGLWGVVSLGMGTAIGVSIFSIIPPAYSLAGPGMLISMALAMFPMIIFALIYAFMGSAVPVTGASFEWPRRFISPFAGFFISWLRIAGSTAALVVLTMVLVSYIGNVIDLPSKPTIFVFFLLVFLMNMIGISVANFGQMLMLCILLSACTLYSITGIPDIQIENFTPFTPQGLSGTLAAIPLMISLFLGIESAVEVGGEIKKPKKTIPLGIVLSVLLTCTVYLIVAVVTIGVLGHTNLLATQTPLLDSAQISIGTYGKWLILLTAIVSIGSSINATFIILTRFLYAMAKSGMLPSALAKIDPKNGIPRNAVILTFGLCCLGLFTPDSLIFLFLAVNIPTLLKYAAICLSSIRLLKLEPQLHDQAFFKPSRKVIKSLGYLGVILSIIIIILGFQTDYRPFLALLIWSLIGILYYVIYGRKNYLSTPRTEQE